MLRRTFLGLLGTAGATAAISTPAVAGGKEFAPHPDTLGVLFDATRCIGCRKCEAACNEVNNLPAPDKKFDDLTVLDQKRRTDDKTLTVVNKYQAKVARCSVKASVITVWNLPVLLPVLSRLSRSCPTARSNTMRLSVSAAVTAWSHVRSRFRPTSTTSLSLRES